MTIHHRGAIRMAQIEARTGRHAAVRQLAKNIETSQTAEIASMAAMLRQPLSRDGLSSALRTRR